MLFPTANAIHFISQDVDDYTADVVVPVDVAAQTITSVAMDPINGVIYYATLDTFGIHRVNLTGENQTSILDEHPTAITSLEVDYATQNVYFVDSYENRLEVASTDGRRRRVLHDGLVSPTGLALDPVSLTMFYIDTGDIDREESPKIYSAAMDGSSPEAIVTGHPLNHPLYIAVDNGDGVDGLIYWTDVGTNMVYCASLLGEEPRAIAGFGPLDIGSVVHGVAFFGGHVFFTDSGLRKIYESTTILMDKSVYMEGFNYLSDIKIVETRKGHIGGCLNTSRCDYLCLPNPNVPSKQTCACATGIEPLPDGSCPEVPNTFLLVAGQNSLRRIALDNPSGEYVDIPLYDSLDGYGVNAVDYLLTARGEGYIYFAEMKTPSGVAGDNVWRSRIRRQCMFEQNGDGSEIIHEEDTGIIEDIAVDWTTGNVYFTLNAVGNSRADSHVAMVSGRGAGNKVTLVNTTLHKPRGIALHPLQNTMFWTDFGDPPKVETARMNGMSRTPIITRGQMPFSNLLHPNDVIVDLNTDLVYFCDGGAGIIGATTFLGNAGEIIVAVDDNPDLRRSQPTKLFIRKPWSLTMRHFSPSDRDDDPETEEAELFWSDPEFHLMSSVSLVTTGRSTTGIEKTHLRNILERTTLYKPLAVQFVSIDGHKPGEITGLTTMPCSTHSCEYLCLNINATHFHCLCPDSVPNCRPRSAECVHTSV
ncbi:Low-density lipoprotein receptor-related protein 4 [Geodia barretti]|uniref:Low-density lipoprotein receptor-related protein 4 n=1 Tax=Geodia barretti TaxID=519541 RepID=A0AA35R9Z2_GEOBA|nr:Low-density lipoprotein receptor-related protein 4 [Geodia barretti]